jgi:hypothetical protein
MKKYRLKEEAKEKLKPFLGTIELTYEMPLSDWHNKFNVFSEQFFTCELEEVEERIELMINKPLDDNFYNLRKVNGDDFTDQEKELCEKALNGELFTKDDMEAFVNYSRRVDNINSPTNMLIKDFLRMNNDDY